MPTEKSSGGKRSPEYNLWKNMKQRCRDRNFPFYHNYGGRGIRVCKQWDESYERFLADVGRRPTPQHTFDRIDNDGDYEPSNVRWATRSEQGRNKRNNKIVTLNGERMPLIVACEKLGVGYHLTSNRLGQGWTEERAFNTPVKKDRRHEQSRLPKWIYFYPERSGSKPWEVRAYVNGAARHVGKAATLRQAEAMQARFLTLVKKTP